MTKEIELIDSAVCDMGNLLSLVNAALYILDDTKDAARDAGREGDVFWIGEAINLLNLEYCMLGDMEKKFENMLDALCDAAAKEKKLSA